MAKNGNGIPEPRRLAIIADAIIYGESEAARRHKVNRNSIMRWLEPAGGMAAVRSYIAEVRDVALATMERSVAQAFSRKVGVFSNEHLLEAFVQMLNARKASGTTIVNAPIAQAGASVGDDVGRAILAAERAYLAASQPASVVEAERPALESGDR